MGLKESVADIEPVSQGQTPSTKNMKEQFKQKFDKSF